MSAAVLDLNLCWQTIKRLSASAAGRLAHFLSLPLFNRANLTVMANGQISDWFYRMTGFTRQ
jgi:hypothetical protein